MVARLNKTVSQEYRCMSICSMRQNNNKNQGVSIKKSNSDINGRDKQNYNKM